MTLTEQARQRLAGQFQSKPRVAGLLESIVGPLDDALLDGEAIKTQRWIDTAVGKQLDNAGAIVLEPRLGRDDDAYREAIRFRVFVNVSNGTPTDVIRGLKYLTKGDDLQYHEMPPATLWLFSDGYSATPELADVMQDLSPAGVSDVHVAVSFGENPLRTSSLPEFDDEQSELGGLASSVLHCLDGQRLRTIDGRRIRLRLGYVPMNAGVALTGLFESKS